MDKTQIQVGQKCFAATTVSRARLLCTIEQVNGNMVTVRFPCVLKGKTHEQVYIKDIVLQKPADKPQKPVSDAPKDNPYRRHLENMLSNPQPRRESPVEPIIQDDNKKPVEVAGNLVELYLSNLPMEQRRKTIEGLDDDEKALYIHLLK